MKAFLIVALSCLSLASSASQTVRLEDRSDWWSMNNEKEPILDVPLVEKHFDTNNFKILDLSLRTLTFNDVASRLGKAVIVERRGASYSRSQACYFSGSGSDTIHLIFEGG